MDFDEKKLITMMSRSRTGMNEEVEDGYLETNHPGVNWFWKIVQKDKMGLANVQPHNRKVLDDSTHTIRLTNGHKPRKTYLFFRKLILYRALTFKQERERETHRPSERLDSSISEPSSSKKIDFCPFIRFNLFGQCLV